MYEFINYITEENYLECSHNMSSIDLIMFIGDDVVSNTIADIQKSLYNLNISNIYTHAALVIKPSLLPNYKLDITKTYIIESTYSYNIIGMDNGPPDSLTNQPHFGVQLRDLELVLKSYIKNEKTKLAWFKLNKPLNHQYLEDNFVNIFNRYHRYPFLQHNIFPHIDFTNINPTLYSFAQYFITKKLLSEISQYAFSCVKLISCILHELHLLPKDHNFIYPLDILTFKN